MGMKPAEVMFGL